MGGGGFRQLAGYLLVGGSTALLELLLFHAIHWMTGGEVVVANLVAVVAATAANFVLNGTVTFKGSSNMRRSVVLYLLLWAFNTCFSTFAIQFLAGVGLNPTLAKLATMCCIVAWNFVLYRKVVFR